MVSATTHQKAQEEVKTLFSKNAGLSPSVLRTPTPALRQQLLARAGQAATALLGSIEAQSSRQPDLLEKEINRIALSALTDRIGFVFLSEVLPRPFDPGALSSPDSASRDGCHSLSAWAFPMAGQSPCAPVAAQIVPVSAAGGR